MTSDPHFAWARLSAPGAVVVSLTGLEPLPRVQPVRAAAGFYFLPKKFATFAGALQKALAEQHQGPPMVGPLVVRVAVTKTRPKRTVLPAPLGDVDNFAKGILDACTKTGRFWRDDVQVSHLFATKAWGDAHSIHLTINTMEP